MRHHSNALALTRRRAQFVPQKEHVIFTCVRIVGGILWTWSASPGWPLRPLGFSTQYEHCSTLAG